jgi:FkbM family methyltransferase
MLDMVTQTLLPATVKRRIKDRLGVPSMESSLRNLRTNGFCPRTTLDIGAYHGEWTQLCKSIWPDCSVLMLEASPQRLPKLLQAASGLVAVQAEQALLGASRRSSISFYEQETASSVLPESALGEQTSITLSMSTLDEVTADSLFARPDFIKLDVQGYELEVLKGGRKALSFAEVALLEVNLLQIYEGAPLMHEVLCFMANEGLRAYDICTLYRRPLDHALWQLDIVFVRDNSPLVESKRYQ